MRFRLRLLLPLIIVAASPLPAAAQSQDREVPYWATIRASELNMRAGPSEDYPVQWVYRRPGLPVKVLRLKDGWRLIEDPDGEKGWVVARLLSPDIGAIVKGDEPAPMRADPEPSSALRWRLEPGVVGRLGNCDEGWCRFDVDGHIGWVPAARLWGAGDP